MDTYAAAAYRLSRLLTMHYSSSFGLSSRLFSRDVSRHVYAVYGLVRIADEIVDTYRGDDAGALLNALEAETYAAIDRGFSTDLIVHAFALTANTFNITADIITPFFDSMRTDLNPKSYRQEEYEQYIHGSAEVVGLMCLRIFCQGDDEQYESLRPGAMALGSAYQKVNFLRDLAADHAELGRVYFPGLTFESFDDSAKAAIEQDIEHDFQTALPAIRQLPDNSRFAVMTSYRYYRTLLARISAVPASTIKQRRIRVPDAQKVRIFLAAFARRAVGR